MPNQTLHPIEIVIAEVEHLDALTELMDQYRGFYGQPSNKPAANQFLFERMINQQSVIYLAEDKENQRAIGFLQLYPSFSSVSLEALWILNDLYVAPEYRQQGIARRLVQEAMNLVQQRGDKGLILETAPDNVPAQKLYEPLGFQRDQTFLHYIWSRTVPA